MTSLELIAAVKARRTAAGLVADDGVHCATEAQKAYHDARHGLTRKQIETDHERFADLRAKARV